MATQRNIYDDEFFEQLGISDDLMFRDVFGRDERLAGHLLSLALGRDVGEVEFVHGQHELRPEWDARTTTFDVYLWTQKGTIGELEMQNSHKSELPLRLRTHLSNMDRETIHRGDGFKEVRESVSLFVCTFDPLDSELRRYTIRRYVQETGEPFPDRQTGVLLNARGTKGEVPKELSLFLRYVAGYDDDEIMQSDFVRAIDARVRANRADWKWRRGYVTLQEKFDDARREGIEQGREEGREQARSETVGAVLGLVADGLLTLEEAAARFGISEDELRGALDA